MIDLRELRRYFLAPYLFDGASAVDCTMGNGHDTAFLSHSVGEKGHVWAFGIQQSALDSTAKRLAEENCPANCTLILDSHANLADHVTQPVNAVVFNLGYLPGSGRKQLTTMRSTTLPAVERALAMLGEDAVLLVAVYPGHPEGAAEGEELGRYFSSLSRFRYSIAQFRMLNSPESPFFIVCETRKEEL